MPFIEGPATLWITGLSGAGKSTLAQAVSARMAQAGMRHHRLDGDVLRQGLSADLGFSAADRAEHIRRVAELARWFNDAGLWVIASLVSPAAADRERARRIVGERRFALVWAHAPLSVCEARDTKGLYAKARAGELPLFTGIGAPYEEPSDAALVLDTGTASVNDAVSRVCQACGLADAPAEASASMEMEAWFKSVVERKVCTPIDLAQAMVEDGYEPAQAHVMAACAWIRYGQTPLAEALGTDRNRLIAHTLRAHLGPALYAAAPAAPSSPPAPLSGPWDPTLETRHVLDLCGHAVRLSMVCEHPRLALIEGLLSPQECAQLIEAARPTLAPDQVVNHHNQQPLVDASMRGSEGCALDSAEQVWLQPILRRIHALVGWPESHGETLSVSRYGVDAHFDAHHDYFGDPTLPRPEHLIGTEGDRIATLVIYLNDVQGGGDTRFPELPLRIRPRCGSAVFFSYRRPDGSPDPASLHAGQPVQQGEKWIATLWLREHALVEAPAEARELLPVPA